MSDAPLCKGCKHCMPEGHWSVFLARLMPSVLSPSPAAYRYAKCRREVRTPASKSVDNVTGEITVYDVDFMYCAVERAPYLKDVCGPSGKHFEPRT